MQIWFVPTGLGQSDQIFEYAQERPRRSRSINIEKRIRAIGLIELLFNTTKFWRNWIYVFHRKQRLAERRSPRLARVWRLFDGRGHAAEFELAVDARRASYQQNDDTSCGEETGRG